MKKRGEKRQNFDIQKSQRRRWDKLGELKMTVRTLLSMYMLTTRRILHIQTCIRQTNTLDTLSRANLHQCRLRPLYHDHFRNRGRRNGQQHHREEMRSEAFKSDKGKHNG